MENEFISYTFHHWNEFEAVWPNNKNFISKENISFEVSDCGCMCSCKPFTCVHLFTAPYLCICGVFFFQKNLVTLICCYSLLSGGLNKWLLHLNAGKMRNKPDYTNQKPRYHSWLQRYSLGNWLVQGPREMFEWQQMEYTDWFICWQSSSSWWYPKARARTMENTESAFLVSSEVSGSKTFCLAFFKTEFINWSAWARRKGGGVERARWRLGSSPSKPQKTYVMHFQYKNICISRTSLTGLICLYFLCP